MRNYRVCDSIEAYAFEKALDKAYIDLDRVDKMSDTEAYRYQRRGLRGYSRRD